MSASRTRTVRLAASASVLCLMPIVAMAGPIGVITMLFELFYIICAVAIGAALLGLVLCRFIRDPKRRAIARLSIVLLIATPVPLIGLYGTSSFVPAIAAALLGLVGTAQRGVGYAIVIAYAISFAAFLPLVRVWFQLGERYSRRR